jgi:hypothetical protein
MRADRIRTTNTFRPGSRMDIDIRVGEPDRPNGHPPAPLIGQEGLTPGPARRR